MTPTSPKPPYVVAVVGAGPSGIYAAEALTQQSEVEVEVLVIDRLPVPFGLVRYGVAPDHPSIRSIRTTLERTLDKDGVTFFGDVMVGRDLSVAELAARVDACLYAFGAGASRRLGIAGEDAIGSISAPDFVSWYTGNPEIHLDGLPGSHPPVDRGQNPPSPEMAELLDGLDSAVVVGGGNVALDVARILIKNADELAPTDMADDVLAALRAKRVTDVHLLARRGPGHTTMTTKELRELGKINDCDVIIHPDDVDWDAEQESAQGRIAQRNVAEFSGWAAGSRRRGASRRVHLHFWSSPVEFQVSEGQDGGDGVCRDRFGEERVSGVRVADTRPTATGHRDLEAGLVVRAIGYRGVELSGLPFDAATGQVPHDEGRVLTASGGRAVPGTYVTGWIKRGPTGVIGTNKSDAVETVQSLLHDIDEGDLESAHPDGLAALTALLGQRGITPLDLPAWHRIDAAEVDLGRSSGRARATLAHRSELLEAGREHTEPGELNPGEPNLDHENRQ